MLRVDHSRQGREVGHLQDDRHWVKLPAGCGQLGEVAVEFGGAEGKV